MATVAEQFIVEHAARFQSLVSGFKPPSSPRAAAETTAPNPDMIVSARLRPLLEEETAAGFPAAVFPRKTQAGKIDVHELKRPIRGPPALPTLKSSSFQADRVFGPEATTEQIYEEVVKPLVPWAWGGGIGTMFAYGQTSSGKTHTVSQLERLVAETLMNGELEGARRVYLTIIELAGNSAFDLLNARRPISILEDSFGVTQLAGAAEHLAASAPEVLALIEAATSFRRTVPTKRNDASSRSHAVCRVRIENPALPAAEDGILYLIDLAGSEAARDSAAHGADRMRETREINVSLSVLKDCIRGRAEADALLAAGGGGLKGGRRRPHVPFRQSALTKVLKHVFDPAGGRSCRTVVVACVNPSLADVGASRNTLRYAEMLRVLLPKAKGPAFDPEVPLTWSNAQLMEWIDKNSGQPPISSSLLAPSESGLQLLRLPEPEFETRCMQTPGVGLEHAKAFRSKFWQMHVDSQRAGASKEQPSAAESTEPDTILGHLQKFDRSSSRDPDANAHLVPFKERVRPGMAVRWTPPQTFPVGLPPGMKMVVVLCPAAAVGGHVKDCVGRDVNTPTSEENGTAVEEGRHPARYLCAIVMPGVMAEAYEVNLWRQVLVEVEWMDAEVVLEYDVATRYYYLAV
ncbi:Kinesin-like protein [Pleurostoma richardsiae]|uniref:Kinesin-like protein n=1 Tax=Pleurostoma richardsiae TaxID=41990 RepID=A0AA38VIG4_9PEZI|nr:Kinesin-like protein [Pleurostoma richardsiae]